MGLIPLVALSITLSNKKKLQHFYIAEEQSIYLMSHKDAAKLKQWVELCKQQLSLTFKSMKVTSVVLEDPGLGNRCTSLPGKGTNSMQ